MRRPRRWAEAKLTKALSLVPDYARAHMYLGLVEMWTKRAAQGIAECEHALELDRNLAAAHSIIGSLVRFFVGRAEETEGSNVAQALRLSPRDTIAYIWMYFAGLAKLHLGKYEEAVMWFRRSIEANRNYPAANLHLAAALALLGRFDEAHSAAKAGLALNPSFTISRARADWTRRSDDPTYLAQLERIFEAPPQGRGPRAMIAVRPLAAILVADVDGHSRLMDEDMAETAKAARERLEAARPIVSNLGGRIVKTTGDGVMLEFPSVVAAFEYAIVVRR